MTESRRESWLTFCRSHTEAWFRSLESADAELAQHVHQRYSAVRRQALARTLLAMAREAMLTIEPSEDDFHCVVPGGQCSLIAEGFWSSRVLLRADLDKLEAVRAGSPAESIDDAARLLQIISEYRPEIPSRWQRLAIEITDSVLNEALALAAHARTEARLDLGPANEAPAALVARIRSLDCDDNGSLFLDQWAATGHPLHTVPKARVNLSPADAMAICPEFHPTVPVRLSAIHRQFVSAEQAPESARLSDWFAVQFPDWYQRWQAELGRRGLEPDHFDPMPVHPWQADHVLAETASDWIAQRKITLLDGPALPMLPGLSVRSLVPADDRSAYGFKLSLGIRLTSGIRTITPRSCHMGRRVGDLLDELFRHDPGYAGSAGVIGEPVGAYFDTGGRQPELEKHYSMIARNPVNSCIPSGYLAAPAAALAEPFPSGGWPLLLRLAGINSTNESDSLRVYERYARCFLKVVLRTHLVYGIALEAHGQNVVVSFNPSGRLAQFLFRDLAGIRIHEPTLRRNGIPLEVHPDRRTVVQDFDDHHFWLRHRAYHAHLGHIAYGLSHATGISEKKYWQVTAKVTSAVFDQLRSEVEPDHWQRERYALLEAPWEAKASLRMRLMDQVRDLPFTTNNPMSAEETAIEGLRR